MANEPYSFIVFRGVMSQKGTISHLTPLISTLTCIEYREILVIAELYVSVEMCKELLVK